MNPVIWLPTWLFFEGLCHLFTGFRESNLSTRDLGYAVEYLLGLGVVLNKGLFWNKVRIKRNGIVIWWEILISFIVKRNSGFTSKVNGQANYLGKRVLVWLRLNRSRGRTPNTQTASFCRIRFLNLGAWARLGHNPMSILDWNIMAKRLSKFCRYRRSDEKSINRFLLPGKFWKWSQWSGCWLGLRCCNNRRK